MPEVDGKTLAALAIIVLAAVAFLALQKPAEITGPAANQTAFYSGEFVLRVQAQNGTAIPGAQVNYSLDGKNGGGFTNETGEIPISITRPGLLSLRVARDGFQTAVVTILATRSTAAIKLKEARPAAAALEAIETSAAVAITARGAGGEAIDAGVARVYDLDTAHLLGEAALLDGKAELEGLPAGVTAYIVAEADGFEPFDGSNRAQVLNAGTLFEAILEKRGVVGTRLRCLDANGKKTACIMTLFKPPAVELESSFTQGEWLPKLGEGAYYFVGEADGYLPANSGLFGAGEDAQAVLQTPTNENAAKLSVTATRAGKPLAASVLVRGVDGSFVTAEQKAPASFTLAKAAYKITVQAGGAKRSERVQLGEDKAVEFVFEEGKAYVNASVTPAVNATITVIIDGAKAAEGRPGELIEMPAAKAATVRAEAVGRIPVEKQVAAIAEGRTATVRLELESEAKAPAKTSAKFIKAAYANGTAVAELQEGGEYSLFFEIVPSRGSRDAGFAIAVNGGTIKGYPAGAQVKKSSVMNAPSAVCTDLAQDSALSDSVKWVDSRFPAASKTLEYKVNVSTGSRELRVGYRGYSVDNGSFDRDPQDPSLGSAESTGEKAGCYAAFKDFSIPVKGANVAQANATAGNKSNASQGVFVENGSLKAGATRLDFSIDAVLPADAVPFSMEPQSGCSFLYSFNSTSGAHDCYSYANGFVKLDAFKAGCPLQVKGDKIEGDASATLVVTGSCVKNTLEIPLGQAARLEESILVTPTDLGSGDGTAKIFYLIDERQTGQRTADAGGKSIALQKSSVRALSWKGSGTLPLKSGGETIATLSYRYKKSYFSGKGGVGGERITSCGDWLCCARAWCNQDAFKQAVEKFKARAGEVAQRTAFRNGAGQPLAALGLQAFEYVTVAQVTEGAAAQLKSLGFETSGSASLAGEACASDAPKVLELKASTSDGVNWAYSSRTLSLEQNLDAASNKPELCGFLHAENATVTKTAAASMASLNQVKDGVATPVPSFFTDVAGVKAACLAAVSTACAEHSGKMVSLPALAPAPLYAQVNCVPAAGKCVPVCTPTQGDVQTVPYQNRAYLLLRFGLTEACTGVPPALEKVFTGAKPFQFMGLLDSYMGGFSTAAFGGAFYDSPLDPAGFTQAQGLQALQGGFTPWPTGR